MPVVATFPMEGPTLPNSDYPVLKRSSVQPALLAAFALLMLCALPGIVTAQLSISTSVLSDYNGADVTCFGACDGIAIVTPSGGSGSYSYLWEDGQTTQVALNLCSGITLVTVTDLVSLASVTDSVILFNPPPLGLTLDPFEFIAGFNISCPDADDGQVTAMASGGVGGYSYIWSDGQTTPTAVGFGPGLVFLNVLDANFCSTTDTVVLTEPDPIQAGSALVLDISCAGRTDGEISPNLAGGSGGYSYLWADGPSTDSRDGLDTGTYSMMAMDVVGCLYDTAFTIGISPEITIRLDDVLNAACPNSADGAAQLSVNGGTPPYSYSWSNGWADEDQTGMLPGTYAVTVTDDRACSNSRPVSIQASSPLSVSALKVNPSCGNTDGAIHLGLAGETGTVSYLWSDGQTESSATDLGSGTYDVTVMDDLCILSRTFSLDNTSSIELNTSSIPSACGGASGSATAEAVSGEAPFSWIWSDGQSTETATGLAPGSYQVEVTDNTGCTAWATIEVEAGSDLDINVDLTAPSFCGAHNGGIELTPAGGVPPYSYDWSNGGNTATVTGLRSGIYTVIVQDGEGCQDTLFIPLEDDGAPVAVVSSSPADCGVGNASALASVSSGTTPYLYFWATGDTTDAVAGIAPHRGFVCVIDGNGCLGLAPYDIPGSEGILAEADVYGISCQSIDDGSIDVAVLRGSDPQTFAWADGPTTEDRDSLTIITYELSIIDERGCQVSGPVTVGDGCDVPLIAVDDLAEATEGIDGIIEVLSNDSYPDRPDITVTVLQEPLFGSAQVNPDGTITYSPTPDYLGIDSFTYLLCNGLGICDTAVVLITVLPEFEIPDAFSPNGDGINDFFEIRGLAEFPDNVLTVFNRWGDEVYRSANYDGSWDGRYDGDSRLADGTYYYVLELGDGEETKSGFVVIHR